MEPKSFFAHRKALVVMCIAVILLAQEAQAGPLVPRVQSSSDQVRDLRGEPVEHMLKRVARMTPLWRIMSSKPSGAFCQNNFECATGLCREGRCSTSQRPSLEPVKY
ncbi:liver-expressed antimicrobial peptide 2 [Fundulus heteroclitus]|uniref:Liver-expressed antimicrobial peptide 2 n=1 Tax=Fundulus heteroclitus TaxID=8078 RepID=A0A3Q2PV87_FUNHE|nr:liver-expressed antimicrobial peptide 2 [Fundulus heteroclitus]XP_036002173.1 liver-expressed antimicrobial peptide 2 [Fundulus heteroclitus]